MKLVGYILLGIVILLVHDEYDSWVEFVEPFCIRAKNIIQLTDNQTLVIKYEDGKVIQPGTPIRPKLMIDSKEVNLQLEVNKQNIKDCFLSYISILSLLFGLVFIIMLLMTIYKPNMLMIAIFLIILFIYIYVLHVQYRVYKQLLKRIEKQCI